MSTKIAYTCIKYIKKKNHFCEIMHQNRQCRQNSNEKIALNHNTFLSISVLVLQFRIS